MTRLETAVVAKRRRMLGLSLHIWEDLMLLSLGAAALAAFSVIVTTWAVVQLQRHEARESAERIASLNSETARQQADNLALQWVMSARHVGVIGLDERPRAEQWFAETERFPGTKLLIQVIPGDVEAQNLANEIAMAVQVRSGWTVEFVDERRSHVSLRLHEGVRLSSPSSTKAWDPNDGQQQEFARLAGTRIALAKALTLAGLGVGSYPVENGGLIEYPDHPPLIPWFDPPLDGVFLEVGARPISLTMDWIK
jgi:hypothetical protein